MILAHQDLADKMRSRIRRTIDASPYDMAEVEIFDVIEALALLRLRRIYGTKNGVRYRAVLHATLDGRLWIWREGQRMFAWYLVEKV